MSGSRNRLTRREFLKSGAAAAGAAALGLGLSARHAHAASETLRVGVIGCGSTGLAAARDCKASAQGVEIVALADPLTEHLDAMGAEFNVPAKNRFAGFDGYRQMCAMQGLDLVIVASPAAFRPVHMAAAIEAGKHVLVEPPVAICPAGYKMVLDACKKARGRLAVGVLSWRRHDPVTIETMKRIADGGIGKIINAQCYWNQGALAVIPRRLGEPDLVWQLKNWRRFRWLSGDLVLERHIHNLDVISWLMGSPPDRVHALGGRQHRPSRDLGDIYDHFGGEIFYPGDVHVLTMCRQIDGTEERIGEYVIGTKGSSDCRGRIMGQNPWTYQGPRPNPRVLAFSNLIGGIRKGDLPEEGTSAAESALTAIMVRESAYTRMNFKRSWFLSKVTLNMLPPENLSFKAAMPVGLPPVPGVYQLPGAG